MNDTRFCTQVIIKPLALVSCSIVILTFFSAKGAVVHIYESTGKYTLYNMVIESTMRKRVDKQAIFTRWRICYSVSTVVAGAH